MPTELATPVRDDLETLDITEVAALMKCSPRSLYNHIDAGRFPKPFKLGRSTRWRASVVREWLDEKAR